MGILPVVLWFSAFPLIVAWALVDRAQHHPPLRLDRARAAPVPERKREAWEDQGEEWKTGMIGGSPSWEDPDNHGADDWQADPDPETSFQEARARFGTGWRGLYFGREIGCPVCEAANRVRRGDYAETHNVEGGGAPIIMKFSLRSRDSAMYCHVHDLALYQMSDDTVIRYDPRYHRQQDEPDSPATAA